MAAWEGRVERAARELVERARELGVSIGCAESCTGGLVCGAITAIPGSSEVLRGGVVSYAPDVKRVLLGVGGDVIDDPARGVVSRDCARQMSEGARRLLSCDVAVSVTGIAGPGGAEPGKPVGTVWFGLSGAGGSSCELHRFEGGREDVRAQATIVALGLLRGGIEESRRR